MEYHYFFFTKTKSAREFNEQLNSDNKISIDTFIPLIKKFPLVEPWAKFEEYEKYEPCEPECLNWRCLSFYLLKKGQKVPDSYTTSLSYTFKNARLGGTIIGSIDPLELKILLSIATELSLNLLFLDSNMLVTPELIDQFEKKQVVKGPKLTQKQEDVLSEVENDAAWIYIPTDKTQEIISYLGASSKESEIVSGLYKAFEKDFTGLATYQNHSILFGKNLMTLPVPKLKNSSMPINDDDLQKIIWNLSIRFGDAQFYSYNKYEVWYIHYKNGALVYSGTNGDDGPSHIFGSITEEIELSDSKVKELAEANGIGIEDFLITCMKGKIKCHLIDAKNGMQVWWDGIMDDVKKAMKEDKKK